jgi:hypothetical protein
MGWVKFALQSDEISRLGLCSHRGFNSRSTSLFVCSNHQVRLYDTDFAANFDSVEKRMKLLHGSANQFVQYNTLHQKLPLPSVTKLVTIMEVVLMRCWNIANLLLTTILACYHEVLIIRARWLTICRASRANRAKCSCKSFVDCKILSRCRDRRHRVTTQRSRTPVYGSTPDCADLSC